MFLDGYALGDRSAMDHAVVATVVAARVAPERHGMNTRKPIGRDGTGRGSPSARGFGSSPAIPTETRSRRHSRGSRRKPRSANRTRHFTRGGARARVSHRTRWSRVTRCATARLLGGSFRRRRVAGAANWNETSSGEQTARPVVEGSTVRHVGLISNSRTRATARAAFSRTSSTSRD
jgi:hypothetical protein